MPEPSADAPAPDYLRNAFERRKNFNELVGKLAAQFNLRRSGYDAPLPDTDRPSRCYPPMFETHPYLVKDNSDRRSAVARITDIPTQPWVSEPLARKRRIGQITKQESAEEQEWYENSGFTWTAEAPDSWVRKFEQFLIEKQLVKQYDSDCRIFDQSQQLKNLQGREARSLKEISDASKGFVAYIYADGNNMGQHIRDKIKTPDEYQRLSEDIFEATEHSVYIALAKHLAPHYYEPDAQSNRRNKTPVWIHPFEIVTIGGDDVLLIVPANKALAIAKTIGETFEEILAQKHEPTGAKKYPAPPISGSNLQQWHRYNQEAAPFPQCCFSLSTGVLNAVQREHPLLIQLREEFICKGQSC
ncbi:Cas10/Cmr2 second palm domain-containing protein [Leptolyngbya sp. 7M]|uniref:Cas10/Cmr2 second palm domain-containing protein n=1 Tax=Leptolyngbya sp. 7M TaxID=2812896 RepID=UPI001B8B4482|nr:hypothetical protein [Leptolyngbya sp. 7M]QYO65092.1 hypothetical protein JVX88_37250 [Leptolyngbya sp. 7M]